MDPIKILIAEDQEILRTGVRLTLDMFRTVTVVGEASNGAECINLCRTLQPHVVLMDLMMPEMNGIDATLQLKQELSQIKVIVFTSFSRDTDIFAAFAAGADAYCLKDIEPPQLELAIKTAASGAVYIDPRVAKRVLQALTGSAPMKPSAAAGKGSKELLSTRELEVIKLLVEGMSNVEIAQKLTISVETVKSHVRNIMAKLQVSDRTQAAIKAIKRGLIDSY